MPLRHLHDLTDDVLARAARIRLACFDVDGTLTDGRLYLDSEGREQKTFHVQDGQGLVLLKRAGIEVANVDWFIPHQANLRIIEAVAKRAGASMDKVFLTVHKYGNMSAATVVVALVEAAETGVVKPNDLILLPAFGAFTGGYPVEKDAHCRIFVVGDNEIWPVS